LADSEAVIFNMVNVLLMRIHQSGHLAELSPEGRTLVNEAIALYKSIRNQIADSFPFWPLGLPTFSDEWVSLGLAGESSSYIAVWRLQSKTNVCALPIPALQSQNLQITCVYPSTQDCHWSWQQESVVLSVSLPQANSARLFQLTCLKNG
jgi:alpha-galactosidase